MGLVVIVPIAGRQYSKTSAIAERVSQLKLYCKMGVRPRRDQVRTRCGR
jgi:hypothetical protein